MLGENLQQPGARLVALARDAVGAHLTKRTTEPAQDLLAAFPEAAGVFVTIRKRTGELRGCVGTPRPVCTCVPHEVIRVAPLAACSDHRFSPVASSELPDLCFEVSILTPPEPVEHTAALNPARYGVTVEDGQGRRGLLLPAIPSIDTVDVQLQEVRRKAGIAPDVQVRMWRFEVLKFAEGIA